MLKALRFPINIVSKKSPFFVIKRTLFTIVPIYQQGIRLNFGKFGSELKPGLRLNLPFYYKILLLDTRERVHTIPTMQVISSDNVTYKVDASVQYKIFDTAKALLNVYNIEYALTERCKMELRNKLSSMTINDVLQKKSEISKSVLDAINKVKEDWILMYLLSKSRILNSMSQ